MMKQHRLFTGIYIAETALSVTMIMITFAVLYIKFGPIYPEENRDRMLVMTHIYCRGLNPRYDNHAFHCSPKLAELIKENATHLENITSVFFGYGNIKAAVSASGSNKKRYLPLKCTDGDFWKIFKFRFIDGNPFTADDIKREARVAVISRSTAMALFSTEKVAGRSIDIKGVKHEVVGVVEDATSVTPECAAALWCPLTSDKESYYNMSDIYNNEKDILTGNCYIYATAKSAGSRERLKKEIAETVERYNADKKRFTHEIQYIKTYPEQVYMPEYYSDDAFKRFIKEILVAVVAFLLIPALNLGNMIFTRIDNRLPEFGVRKAYGATNRSIVTQVLSENMLLTLIGGIAAFALSIAITSAADEWILFLYDSGISFEGFLLDIDRLGSADISARMLFNHKLFVATLMLCMLINIISALIPLALTLRHNIVYSLNKRK